LPGFSPSRVFPREPATAFPFRFGAFPPVSRFRFVRAAVFPAVVLQLFVDFLISGRYHDSFGGPDANAPSARKDENGVFRRLPRGIPALSVFPAIAFFPLPEPIARDLPVREFAVREKIASRTSRRRLTLPPPKDFSTGERVRKHIFFHITVSRSRKWTTTNHRFTAISPAPSPVRWR
jgi:hypothetical protein